MNLFKYFKIIRYNDWWLYKIPPLLTVFYTTIYLYGYCISDNWKNILRLLFIISSSAIYVSIINDITDKKIDLIAGKSNLFSSMSEINVNLILTLTIFLQIYVLIYLNDYGYSKYWYLFSLLAYSLYSIPPFRFKERKYFGILSDALGAHSFPSIAIIMFVFSINKLEPDFIWVLTVFLWSLSYGLRGIIWHQFKDKEADELVGLNTIVQKYKIEYLKKIVIIIFIFEVIGLIGMLYLLKNYIIIFALFFYSSYALIRQYIYNSKIIFAISESSYYQIYLFEFYEFIFPMSILISSCIRCKSDFYILIVQVLIFPNRFITLIEELLDIYKKISHFLLTKIK